MNYKKNILDTTITFMLLCMFTITVFLFFTINVEGSNNKDTYFTFDIRNNVNKTKLLRKENDSSCYMYCQKATKSFTTCIRGSYLGTSTSDYDCSYGYRYLFKQGYKRFMYNCVYEKGYLYARISVANGDGTAQGLWSPDSVYESGVKPPTDYIK